VKKYLMIGTGYPCWEIIKFLGQDVGCPRISHLINTSSYIIGTPVTFIITTAAEHPANCGVFVPEKSCRRHPECYFFM